MLLSFAILKRNNLNLQLQCSRIYIIADADTLSGAVSRYAGITMVEDFVLTLKFTDDRNCWSYLLNLK